MATEKQEFSIAAHFKTESGAVIQRHRQSFHAIDACDAIRLCVELWTMQENLGEIVFLTVLKRAYE